MKTLALIFAAIALSVGWFLYPPMKSEIVTWRFRAFTKGFDLFKKGSKLAEIFGFGPTYLHLRYFRQSCSPDDSLKITKEKIGGIPALFIRPTSDSEKLRPALVYFHGGGWTICSPDFYCNLISEIARRLKIVVIAFDYRKAPEAPFPAAFDDCLEGLIAFGSNAAKFGVDATRVAVGGDSAGGNLALAVTAHLHSGAVPGTTFRVAQLSLIYPALQALDFNLPSFHENAFEPMLHRLDMLHYWHYYLTGDHEAKWVPKMMNNSHASEATRKRAKELLWNFLSDKSPRTPDGAVDEAAVAALMPGTSDPMASPILFSDEVFRQLPPVYLLSSEFDALRDEAIALSKRLTKLGHPLKHRHSMHYHGVIYFSQTGDPEGVRVLEDFTAYMKQQL